MQGEGSEKVGQTSWAPRPVTRHDLSSYPRIKMRHELNTAIPRGTDGATGGTLRILRLRGHFLCQESPIKAAGGLWKCLITSLPKSLASSKLQQIHSQLSEEKKEGVLSATKAHFPLSTGPIITSHKYRGSRVEWSDCCALYIQRPQAGTAGVVVTWATDHITRCESWRGRGDKQQISIEPPWYVFSETILLDNGWSLKVETKSQKSNDGRMVSCRPQLRMKKENKLKRSLFSCWVSERKKGNPCYRKDGKRIPYKCSSNSQQGCCVS